MNIEPWSLQKFYELNPVSDSHKGFGTIINKKRILVGRSDSCDLIIDRPDISAIHGVIEIGQNGGRVYDLNSKSGIFVNGNKTICNDISVGDKIKFGAVEFVFNEYVKSDSLPPVLESLSPERMKEVEEHKIAMANQELPSKAPEPPQVEKVSSSRQKVKSAPEQKKAFSVQPQNIMMEETSDGIPYISYPLAKDPKAEFSEYIFEDADTIFPIFKWDIETSAVEVIILSGDRIYSVDYLPMKDTTYQIVGRRSENAVIEFPYLGKTEKIPFIETSGGSVTIIDTLGYKAMLISDKIQSPNDFKSFEGHGPISLGPQDILKLENNHLQIFIRNTQAPPKIKPAPIFRRDGDTRKFFLILALVSIAFLGLISSIEVDKELEKEKIPERIATILYDRKKFTYRPNTTKKPSETKIKPKTTKKPKEIKPVKEQPKKVAEKPKNRKTKTTEKVAKTVKRPKKSNPKKGGTGAVKRAARNTAPKIGKSRSAKAAGTRSSNRIAKSKGHVDAYKPSNFKGSLNALLAKGGSSKSVVTDRISADDIGSGADSIGGDVQDVKTASVSKEVGSLTGSATGKLDASTDAEGLVDKKSVAAAGIPSQTVVIGNYDASLVAQILRDHLPQFRYCYQQELDKENKSEGLIRLDFNIGASGHVTKAGVDSKSLTIPVQKCVVNVLKGIRFPPPLGGGSVGIRQPMNFYKRSQ